MWNRFGRSEVLDTLNPHTAGFVRCRKCVFMAQLAGIKSLERKVTAVCPVSPHTRATQVAALDTSSIRAISATEVVMKDLGLA